ncbi:unnamed protein product [Urochloa humidicola]
MVAYNSKKYYIDIVETKPSNAICIIKADCMVELVPPFDYKEPVPVKPAVPANTEAATGRTLDGKLSKDKDVVGGVIPLCLAKVKTPALMKLKMLVDNHNEVHQYWELEVDEQVKGEMRRSVFQGPAVSTGGADPVGEIETPEPDATSCPSSIRGGGIGGIEAFGSGPAFPTLQKSKGTTRSIQGLCSTTPSTTTYGLSALMKSQLFSHCATQLHKQAASSGLPTSFPSSCSVPLWATQSIYMVLFM